MPAIGTPTVCSYAIDEEVVLRLEGLRVFDTERSAALPPACVPDWTIATVIGTLHDSDAYVLRCVIADAACLCVAPVSAIEGTA